MEAVGLKENETESSLGKIRIQRDLSTILQLRGKDRMEAILSSDHPRELFQAFPEEEAYLTIKEIGEQDALPLLSLMSTAQCQFLLDLELWRGYEMQLESIQQWLPLLLSCDEGSIRQWLRSIDLETLLLLLKKTIRIHYKENEEDSPPSPPEDPYFTLDGMYYVEILIPSLQHVVEQLLRYLANSDLHRYWMILHQVHGEISAELEERTFRFREARLQDKGFPSMEEALSLYQYLDPKRLKRMLKQKAIHLPGIPEEVFLPSFPIGLKEEKMYFSLCLRNIQEGSLIDRLKMELTYMANQVTVADQPEAIDFSTLQRSLRKVGGYLSIGLEQLSEGNLQKAIEYIEQIPLKFIFQIGFGASLALKWRAEKILRESGFTKKGIPLSILGSPWEEKIEGLLKKRPVFYENGNEMGYREFRSLGEIQSLHRLMDRVEFLGKLFSSLPSFSYSDEISWKGLLLNAYALDQLKNIPQKKLGTVERKSIFLDQVCTEGVNLEESFGNWLLEKMKVQSELERTLVHEMTQLVLKGTDT